MAILSKDCRTWTDKEVQEYMESVQDFMKRMKRKSPTEKGLSLVRELTDLLSKFNKAINKSHYKKAFRTSRIIDHKQVDLWYVMQHASGRLYIKPYSIF